MRKGVINGIDLQLPKYILDHLIPHASSEGVSEQVIIKRILKEYYNSTQSLSSLSKRN